MRSNTSINQSNELYASVQLAVMVAYAAGKLTHDQRQVLRQCVLERTEDDEQRRRMDGMLNVLPVQGRPWDARWFEKNARALSAFFESLESRKQAFALAFDVCQANPRDEILTSQALVKLPEILELPTEFVLELVEKTEKGVVATKTVTSSRKVVAAMGEGERDTLTGGELTLMSFRS